MKRKIEQPKKPYHSPRLIVYGNLQSITRGGNRTGNEAGGTGLKTKTTGKP